MKLKYFVILHIISIMVSGVSYTKIDTGSDNPVPLLKVGEVTTTGSLYNIQFYSRDSLFVGYNKVYFKGTGKTGRSLDFGGTGFANGILGLMAAAAVAATPPA